MDKQLPDFLLPSLVRLRPTVPRYHFGILDLFDRDTPQPFFKGSKVPELEEHWFSPKPNSWSKPLRSVPIPTFLLSAGFAFSSPASSVAIAEMVSPEELAPAYTLGGLQMDHLLQSERLTKNEKGGHR
jgi:hypothetical protein